MEVFGLFNFLKSAFPTAAPSPAPPDSAPSPLPSDSSDTSEKNGAQPPFPLPSVGKFLPDLFGRLFPTGGKEEKRAEKEQDAPTRTAPNGKSSDERNRTGKNGAEASDVFLALMEKHNRLSREIARRASPDAPKSPRR